MPPSRESTLGLLAGRRPGRLPVFAGLPSLTAAGLANAGVEFSSAHTDPQLMALAAASTCEMFGFESAVAPLDMCVEAEALGAGVDFHSASEGFLPPIVDRPLSLDNLPPDWPAGLSLAGAGRVPLVCESIRRLKSGVGREVAIGAWVPGPFTLGWQLFGVDSWIGSVADRPLLSQRLAGLADLLSQVAAAYQAAGADFITLHEMGGSPQVVGPRTFREQVQPAVARLCAAIPGWGTCEGRGCWPGSSW